MENSEQNFLMLLALHLEEDGFFVTSDGHFFTKSKEQDGKIHAGTLEDNRLIWYARELVTAETEQAIENEIIAESTEVEATIEPITDDV